MDPEDDAQKRRAGTARRSDEPRSRHRRCQCVATGCVARDGDAERLGSRAAPFPLQLRAQAN